MKKVYYPAKFKKEENAYNVQFLDFPSGITFGETLEEAYFMAQDVLCIMIEENSMLPPPTLNYSKINTEENEFITLVELDIESHNKKVSTKTVSTTVTMPEWLKELSEEENINFSQLLQKTLKEELIYKKFRYID